MNNLVRMQSGVPAPGTRSGNWVWDGCNWVCCDGDFDFDNCPPGTVPPFPFCPPPGFPPRGCPPWFSGQNSPPWYPGANAGVSFGQVGAFPANPVRGHFFWDGKTLWMFDGAAWVITGGGAAGGTPPQSTAPANPVPGQQWFNGTQLFIWDGNAWIPVSQTKTFIQSSAPPAPNPGDLWWDGTQFHIWDGSAWELVGPGATVGPVPTTTLVFSIMIPAAITGIPASAWNIVNFTSTPNVDKFNGWNLTTHQYMPQKAGYYQFFTTQYYGGAGTTGMSHVLVKNDMGSLPDLTSANVVTVAGEGAPPSTVGVYLSAAGITQLNGTSDFVRLWTWSSSGAYYPIASSVPIIRAYLLP
jgi:hypothetical protein